MMDPGTPHWEGPYLDHALLDNATYEGDVCIDDVGIIRQRRYGNTHMGGGWTQFGCGPLSSKLLLEDGKRPAWVLRMEKRDD